jgi:hypothetical protein
MNFRSTFVLFGLFLAMLWLFGLMINIKRSTREEPFLLPVFHADQPDITITSLRIQRAQRDKKEEFVFTKTESGWTLEQPPAKRAVKVETFRVKNLISAVADAQAAGEVDTSGSLATYGLDNPGTIVTITGHYKDKPDQTWEFFLGNQSKDKAFYYANSSERRGVQGVRKSSVENLLFEDTSGFRPARLFEAIDSEVKTVDIKQRGGKELALKKSEEATWQFVTPPLGEAEYGAAAPPPPSKFAAVPPPRQEESGVKALLTSILSLRVDAENFLPISDTPLGDYGLADGKESLRISLAHKSAQKDVDETLLLGNKEKEFYYARLATDEGVFKIPVKSVEKVFATLNDPGTLRSRDLLALDPRKIDAVEIRRGKDTIKLRETERWHVASGADEWRNANKRIIDELLDALQGKRDIKDFLDNKTDKDLGLDAPAAEVDLWVEGIDREKDKDKKDADKKDMDKKDKKDDKKVDPKIKKDAKPTATLVFGKVEGDNIYVKRTVWVATTQKAKDGQKDKDKDKDKKEETKIEERVTRVSVPKAMLDKLTPKEGALAFLDTSLPKVDIDTVTAVAIQREKDKVEVERNPAEKEPEWLLLNAKDFSGRNVGDSSRVNQVAETLTSLEAEKWLLKVDPKEDLDKYGLKTPALTATLVTKKAYRPAPTAAAIGLAASRMPNLATAPLVVWAGKLADKGETVTFFFGKEMKEKEKVKGSDKEIERTYVYAKHSGSDLLFLVTPDVVKRLRDVDLRDRRGVDLTQGLIDATLKSLYTSPNYVGYYLGASPLATGAVQRFDKDKAKEIKLTVRTPYELRKYHFIKADKTWQDKSGVDEFTVDSDKVAKFVEEMSELKADRLVQLSGGPRTDQKFGDKDATLKAEITLEGGKTITLTVGLRLDGRRYFAHSTAWPEAVFLLPAGQVISLMQPSAFAKERVAAGE